MSTSAIDNWLFDFQYLPLTCIIAIISLECRRFQSASAILDRKFNASFLGFSANQPATIPSSQPAPSQSANLAQPSSPASYLAIQSASKSTPNQPTNRGIVFSILMAYDTHIFRFAHGYNQTWSPDLVARRVSWHHFCTSGNHGASQWHLRLHPPHHLIAMAKKETWFEARDAIEKVDNNL